MTGQEYQKICLKILEDLPQRQREVILRRFGLKNKKETLEEIGKKFGVTRERVRQIENDAISRIEEKKEDRDLKKIFFDFENQLKEQGGLKREDLLLEKLGGKDFQSFASFFLTIGQPFNRFSESEDLYSFWAIEKGVLQKIKGILANIIKVFEKEKKPVQEKEFFSFSGNEDKKVFISSVEISKKIEKGPLGYFGLVDWPEIKPSGVRDKVYLTLKKEGKPLHFKDIARFANNLEGYTFKKKEVFPQTVHNELIKDPRFILVGRGIYGLDEWGFAPGTVRETIENILKDYKSGLSKEEIIRKVLEQRFVKENTILLNLQDKKRFSKDSQGKYILV